MTWRVGRKVGRTIYDADDYLIGVMDTREYAHLAAAAPSLLAALERIADLPPHFSEHDAADLYPEAKDIAREAIAATREGS